MTFMTHRGIIIRKLFTTDEDAYKLYSLFSNHNSLFFNHYTSYNMLCDMYVTKIEINNV